MDTLHLQSARLRSTQTVLADSGTGVAYTVSALHGALLDSDLASRKYFFTALAVHGRAALSYLVPLLHHTDPDFREKAISTLSIMGPQAGESAPALIAAIDLGPAELRLKCSFALRDIGRSAIPHLVEVLNRGSVEVQIHAAAALGFMGAEAEEAIPGLIRALRTRDFRVRASAGTALGWICAVPFETVDTTWTVFGLFPRITVPRYPDAAFDAADALAQALRDGEREVRLAACTAIGRLGYLAKPHKAYLSWMHRHDPDREVAAAALKAHLAAQWREK